MSLKALSQRLGLSQTTISRALNGYPEVSEKTRLRVQEAARELNYRPNPHAKSLATGRTGHVGLILPMEQIYWQGLPLVNFWRELLGIYIKPIWI